MSDVFEFEAPLNYNGSEFFIATVTDGNLTDSKSFTVIVNPVNDTPVANPASGNTDEDNSVVVFLSASDVDGDVLYYEEASDAANGTVTIDASYATYNPDLNFYGSDSFIFTVTDGELSATAEVSVTINPVNDAPILSTVCLLYTSDAADE